VEKKIEVLKKPKDADCHSLGVCFFYLCPALCLFTIIFQLILPHKKACFSRKLDSLDMEKQVRKRKGQSIDDLEKLSAIIKDSIAGVKKEFALDKPVGAGAKAGQ